MAEPLLIFLHIPKTGGTTLEYYMYTAYLPDSGNLEEEVLADADGYLNYGIYHYRGGFYGADDAIDPAVLAAALRRPDVRVAMGHFMFGIQALRPPAVCVTVLREPVARVLSFAYHDLSWANGAPQRPVGAEEFEAYLAGSTLTELDNGQTRRISGLAPPFGGCTAETLEVAKQNLLEHFAVVGLTERFHESLVLFAHTLGWKRDDTYFLARQVGPRRPAPSAAALDLVAERNSLDLELYRFAEALFEERLAALGDELPAELARLESLREATLREWAEV